MQDETELAGSLGISEQSFRYKRADPGKFKGIELAKLNIILQIPREKYL